MIDTHHVEVMVKYIVEDKLKALRSAVVAQLASDSALINANACVYSSTRHMVYSKR